MAEVNSNEATGIPISPGDKPYIPAGGLQIWIDDDGNVDGGISFAVDPWLPDLSADSETPADIMESIAKQGFLLGSICTRRFINACDKARSIGKLIGHPEVIKLKHMAVFAENSVIGTLDLDKARGAFRHGDPQQNLLVEDIYDPCTEDERAARWFDDRVSDPWNRMGLGAQDC